MDRNTRPIGSGRSCGPWGTFPATRPGGAAVERVSRGFLRQLQTRLCVAGVPRHVGRGTAAGAGVDYLTTGRRRTAP